MQAKLRAEKAKIAALEAQRRAEKEATEASNRAADGVASEKSLGTRATANLGTGDAKSNISEYEKTKKSPSAGNDAKETTFFLLGVKEIMFLSHPSSIIHPS